MSPELGLAIVAAIVAAVAAVLERRRELAESSRLAVLEALHGHRLDRLDARLDAIDERLADIDAVVAATEAAETPPMPTRGRRS